MTPDRGTTCAAAIALTASLLAHAGSAAAQASPLDDPGVRLRAEALLQQMTPEEKAGQLSQMFVFDGGSAVQERVKSGGLGSVLFMTDPARINQLQHAAVDGSRLHIPLLFGFDVIHGFRTIFPVPIALAATWDTELVEKAQETAAEEARSVGIHWTFAPMVDIARDPRWGRIVEGAGEDAYLGSAMAAAQVHGFQGDHLGAPGHLVACAKHFAGYGAAEGGRDYEASEIPESQLRNVYLPPFKAAVDAGAGTLMSAYMDLNGVPASGNRWLLHDVLRDEWHFHGFVVSDGDAVKNLKTHGFAANAADAALRAFSAGVNVEMTFADPAYAENLPRALQDGRITRTQLDDAVLPILATKIGMGLFENPYVDEARAAQVLQSPEHRTLALRAAERSAVLLRNEGELLPLKPTAYERIAVIGPLANSKADVTGPWAFANRLDESVTVLEGLKQVAPTSLQVEYAPGVQIWRMFPSPIVQVEKQDRWTAGQAGQEFDRAVRLARRSDLAVLVLGETHDMSGELASRSSLELPGEQQKLLEAVVATGKPVVLVLLSARPLELRWASLHVPAILDAWYPGTEGGAAIANLLFGKAVPGGKLPFTWPRDVGQLPLFYSHNTTHEPGFQGTRYWNEESTPLYPFGYGLSYTRFGYSNLHVDRPRLGKGEGLNVFVDVRNAGALAGDEVVQLYLHQQSGSSSRPVRELKGFRRVTLAPGEKRTVRFAITGADLTYWSSATRSWVQDAASFDVWAGGDSTAALATSFTVVER